MLVAKPDIEKPDDFESDIENPDIENPDIENPDIENPDIENGSIADVTWKVSNTGNTTAAFNVNMFLANETLPSGVKTQLILFKTYRTPVTVPNGCQLGFQTRNVLMNNVVNPTFVVPTSGGVPNPNDSSEKNASMWLAPGEEGRITLRVIDDDLANNLISRNYGSTVASPRRGRSRPRPGDLLHGVGTLEGRGEPTRPMVTPTVQSFLPAMPIHAKTVCACTAVRGGRANRTGRP